MFWKYFRLQDYLNRLFDEGWCLLGLPDGQGDWHTTDHGTRA